MSSAQPESTAGAPSTAGAQSTAGVGVLRRYQRFADGTWRDGRLMEMLADELTPD